MGFGAVLVYGFPHRVFQHLERHQTIGKGNVMFYNNDSVSKVTNWQLCLYKNTRITKTNWFGSYIPNKTFKIHRLEPGPYSIRGKSVPTRPLAPCFNVGLPIHFDFRVL